ncbi:MAG: FkbM family methyltransferase [Gemmataceae bacterium]|nr:FkbM family methyltransferase [Gemmataceae bacterium]
MPVSERHASLRPPVWEDEGRSTGPPKSAHWLGRLLGPLRRLCWRFLGLPTALRRAERQTGRLLLLLNHLGSQGHGLFRPGTLDWDIFYSVVVENEYRLPDAFAPDDILVDIGVHVGSFCLAGLLRGAGRVYGFEAEVGNYEQAVRNLRCFGGRAQVSHRAVWRSDRPATVLYHTGYSEQDGSNTGGGNVLWATAGQSVQTVALDEVLREVTEEGNRRVRLLKLDCEGSEYPILLTSRLLHLVDAIHMEYHVIGGAIPAGAHLEGVDRFTPELLEGCLQRNGFRVTRVAEPAAPDAMGKLFATRAPLAASRQVPST